MAPASASCESLFLIPLRNNGRLLGMHHDWVLTGSVSQSDLASVWGPAWFLSYLLNFSHALSFICTCVVVALCPFHWFWTLLWNNTLDRTLMIEMELASDMLIGLNPLTIFYCILSPWKVQSLFTQRTEFLFNNLFINLLSFISLFLLPVIR